MNTTYRILLTAALVASMAACTKKTVEQPPQPEPEPAPVVQQPAPDDGRYKPEDLDTDSCLRQRVVYFDFDQAEIRPEFAAIMGCHAKYLRDRSSARMMRLAAPEGSRGGSMSSMRNSHSPPLARASSQLPTAASSDPKWSGPVGEGAKRPR